MLYEYRPYTFNSYEYRSRNNIYFVWSRFVIATTNTVDLVPLLAFRRFDPEIGRLCGSNFN